MKPLHFLIFAVAMVAAATGGYFAGSASRLPTPDPTSTEAAAPNEEPTWSDLALTLNLDGRQGAEIVRSLNELKNTFLETTKLKTVSGETSPFAYLCARIEGASDQPAVEFYNDFLTYMRTNTAEGSEKTYFEILHDKELETYKHIADSLDPQRREAFTQLSIESLYDIETGYDPFQSALDQSHLAKTQPQHEGAVN